MRASLLLSLGALVGGCAGKSIHGDAVDHGTAGQNAIGGSGSTGEPGSPWAGKTYLLTVPSTSWISPRGIGTELNLYGPSFLLKVDDTGSSLVLGTAQPNATPTNAVQDGCAPTAAAELPAAASTLAVGPLPLRVHLINPALDPGEDSTQVTVTAYDFELHDVVPNGNIGSKTGSLTATLDFTELSPLFIRLGPSTDRDSLCRQFGDTYGEFPGGRCAPCPTAAAEPYCVTVFGEHLSAIEAPNVSLAELTEAEVPESCKPIRFR